MSKFYDINFKNTVHFIFIIRQKQLKKKREFKNGQIFTFLSLICGRIFPATLLTSTKFSVNHLEMSLFGNKTPATVLHFIPLVFYLHTEKHTKSTAKTKKTWNLAGHSLKTDEKLKIRLRSCQDIVAETGFQPDLPRSHASSSLYLSKQIQGRQRKKNTHTNPDLIFCQNSKR